MPEEQNLLRTQFEDVSRKHRGLRLQEREDGSGLVTGELHFIASYKGESLEDMLSIELKIPTDYPKELPMVKEIGGRIPQNFHHHDQGTLCLGVLLEMKMKFQKNPTLLGFIDEQIIPFLYSFSYCEKNGKMPFGEFSHDGEGIIQYYQQLLKLESQITVLGFLRILADDDYRGHHPCLCCSGKTMRNCHGQRLREITVHQSPAEFTLEYMHVGNYLSMSGTNIPKSYISKSVKKHLHKARAK